MAKEKIRETGNIFNCDMNNTNITLFACGATRPAINKADLHRIPRRNSDMPISVRESDYRLRRETNSCNLGCYQCRTICLALIAESWNNSDAR